MSDPTLMTVISEHMYQLAVDILELTESFDSEGSDDDFNSAVLSCIDSNIATIQAPLASATEDLVDFVTTECAKEAITEVQEPVSDTLQKGIEAAAERIRDYALRFRDATNKPMQRFSCTILTELNSLLASTAISPTATQLVALSTALQAIEELTAEDNTELPSEIVKKVNKLATETIGELPEEEELPEEDIGEYDE